MFTAVGGKNTPLNVKRLPVNSYHISLNRWQWRAHLRALLLIYIVRRVCVSMCTCRSLNLSICVISQGRLHPRVDCWRTDAGGDAEDGDWIPKRDGEGLSQSMTDKKRQWGGRGGEGEKKKVFSPGERGEIVGPWKEGMREKEKEGARRDSGPKQAEFSWGWKDEKGRDSDREKGELLCHSEEELSSVWPFQTNSHPFIQSLLNLTHVQKKKIIKIPPWTLLSFISCFPALFSHKYGLGTGPHLLCSYSALSQVIERWFCNYSLFFCQMMTA